jgi:uncharacterized protein
MTLPAAEKTWVPLSPRERRVVGVLVEKQKTTPEYYPMTVAAIVTGCNQKTNRDPVTNYDADDVEETLQGLRKKGAAVQVEGAGRAVKWKHTLYDWLDLKGKATEMAVLAELLLRGPQTEGDLRARASRMDAIPDLPALQAILESLAGRGLVVYLSPPGQKRGVMVTHGLYPPEELERARQAYAHAPAPVEDDDRPGRAAPASAGVAAEVAALRAELEALRGTVQALAAEVQGLKAALGA